MRWKTVALAGALGSASAGCNIAYYAARNLANEPHVVCTQLGIVHDLRKAGRAAWQEVRVQYPRRAFSAEFRDGFLDGYVDYLDRGGNGSVPAVPPSKYTRHKKYYTENGQCLLKEYLLGFKYGQEVAIATGRRQFLTVPVLLPQEPSGPPKFDIRTHVSPVLLVRPVQPPGSEPQLPLPRLVPNPGSEVPPLPFPEPDPTASPAIPDMVPIPVPALPVPPPGPAPVVVVPVEPAAGPRVKLPAPPPEVPSFPDHIPTPSVLDDLPVVAPNHVTPPPLAPLHPEPREK